MPTPKGYKHTKETRRKISKNHRHYQSKETKEKISKALLKNPIKYWKGKKLSKEHKRKLSKALKGKPFSEEHKQRISEALRGRKRPPLSKEWKRKIGLAMKGNKCYAWQGGKSFEPYSVDWTKDLKRAIRKRDKYTCQICGIEPAIFVHHIDYNKKNCSSNNLITLCPSCHSKTNYNRDYWIKFFNKLIK